MGMTKRKIVPAVCRQFFPLWKNLVVYFFCDTRCRWARRKVGVEEWLVSTVTAMYEGAQTAIRTPEGDSTVGLFMWRRNYIKNLYWVPCCLWLECFGLSCEDTQDHWRHRATYKPTNTGLLAKGCFKFVSMCVCGEHFHFLWKCSPHTHMDSREPITLTIESQIQNEWWNNWNIYLVTLQPVEAAVMVIINLWMQLCNCFKSNPVSFTYYVINRATCTEITQSSLCQ